MDKARVLASRRSRSPRTRAGATPVHIGTSDRQGRRAPPPAYRDGLTR